MTLVTFNYILFFVVGICFGSFMNVLVYRIPKGISLSNPPSTCPSCNNKLKWYHNIPLISWLFLKARCGFCGDRISSIYPILEFLTGLLGIYIYWIGTHYTSQNIYQISFTFFFFYLYLAMSIIDYKTHLVADILNIPAALIAIFLIGNNYHNFLNNFYLWLAIGAFFYVFVLKIYSKIRGLQVMGEGDIPILMGMGALLGLQGFLLALFISALSGGVLYFIDKKHELPFIPALAIGTFITFNLEYIFGIKSLFFFLGH